MKLLLNILSDGLFYSRKRLKMLLNSCDKNIEEQVKKLQEMGVIFNQVDHGYQLKNPLKLIDQNQIMAQLSIENKKQINLHTALTTDSTNDWIQTFSRVSTNQFTVAVAEYQTNGRGRRGRHWQVPLGSSITMSFMWNRKNNNQSLYGLSLLVALAIINAIDSNEKYNLQVKWPNDILWNYKKLGGILVEIIGDINKAHSVIIGIGLNGILTDKQKSYYDQPVVDLHQAMGEMPNRNVIIANIIEQLSIMIKQFEREGFSAFQSQWNQKDAFRDQQVVITRANKELAVGKGCGVDEFGGFKISCMNKIDIFYDGEVSVRGL